MSLTAFANCLHSIINYIAGIKFTKREWVRESVSQLGSEWQAFPMIGLGCDKNIITKSISYFWQVSRAPWAWRFLTNYRRWKFLYSVWAAADLWLALLHTQRQVGFWDIFIECQFFSSRFPCCVLLALSWNTNENPSTNKLSRAIN